MKIVKRAGLPEDDEKALKEEVRDMKRASWELIEQTSLVRSFSVVST